MLKRRRMVEICHIHTMEVYAHPNKHANHEDKLCALIQRFLKLVKKKNKVQKNSKLPFM